MSVEKLIAELRERDIALWVDEGRLRFSAPPGVMSDALRARLAENREALIDWLTALMNTAEQSAPKPIARIERDGELPLSFAQERLWFIDQLGTGGAAYNIAMALTLQGDLNVAALKWSFESVIARHEILRSQVVTRRHRPVLQFESWNEFDLPVIPLEGMGDGEAESAVCDAVHQEIGKPFDLNHDRLLRARLFRVCDDEHVLVLVIHHIVSDAWSLGVLLSELSGFYREQKSGEAYTPPLLSVQYVDYVAWQRNVSSGARFDKQIAYWRQRLSDLTPLELPSDRARPVTPSNSGGSEGFIIEGQLLEQCRKLCQQQRVTPFVLMLAVFKVLLHRYTAATDIGVGIPVAGRNTPGSENLIGCFLNTLVLRTDLSGAPTFSELLSSVRQTAIEGQAHQDVPFEQILQVLEPERSTGRSPLFEVLFNYIDMGSTGLDLEGLDVSQFGTLVQLTKFDLTCYVYGGPQQLTVTFDYATDLFEAETIRMMLRHFRNLLKSAVAHPADAIDHLIMRDEQECQRIADLQSLPSSEVIPARALDQTIVEWFSERAHAQPDQAAVITADETVSRGELELLANRAAAGITQWCAQRDQPLQGRIGLMFEHVPNMVAAMLAVMKSGHAFVPLDPTAPDIRLANIVDDADVSMIIVDDSLTGLSVAALPEMLHWSQLVEGTAAFELTIESLAPDLPAYLLYTSGSTGSPKGVLQTHRGLMHHACAFSNALSLSPDDRLSLLSAFTFDTAIQDIFAALLSGAALCAVNLRDVRAQAAGRMIEQQAISVLHMTPTVFRHLFTNQSRQGRLQSVRVVVLGGEPARTSDHALYRQHFNAGCALVNGLGATECSTVLQYRMDHDTNASLRLLPVGFALPGTEIVLLDAFGNETDVFGEIAVIGVPEGTCYWRDTEQTAQRFRAAPGSDDVRRMYLTGDLGSRRADGSIVFEGRRDHQVKLRGMRIELTEVESMLDAHESVRRAAAILGGEPGNEFLFAACQPQEDGAAVDADVLRAYLRRTLPEYMVPSRILMVDTLPLTAGGKVDRRALAALAMGESEVDGMVDMPLPRSELERAIAEIWQQVLKLETVPLRRNFFDLGGHSLLLVEVRARLEELMGCSIAMPDLFQYPTIESLAGHLDTETGPVTTAALSTAQRGSRPDDEPIAIIAMAARLPGASDLDAFWRNLCDGVESIQLADVDELIAGGLDERLARDPRFVAAHSSITDVELFDAGFFGYTPREAEMMDPQHRLFLECATEALERAGCDPQRHPGAIGVFAGSGMTNYLFNLIQRPDLIRASGGWQAVIRSDKDYLPMRVSYKLNLRGPSINVQTACSTSLVAVHEACNSLLRFDCDLALAGGVTLRFPRHPGYLHEEGGILSSDGHCRPFDEKGEGTVFGEGVGVVVLKRLDEALRDGDPIRAVIRGTAINNDGADKVGFTAPSVSAQAELVAQAHAAAGVEPSSIGYVEAHGTATSLGDPIEMSALNQAFGGARRGSCALGSVKSNIGHLDRAAGVAGLMKTVLMLEQGKIPPSLHYQATNSEIDFDAGPFYVNTVLRTWERPDGQPRCAGVSSFGMGGTNAHVVLEEAPEVAASDMSRRWQVLPVSAKSDVALVQACENLAVYLEQHPELPLADVAYTLQVGRTGFEHRVSVVCDDVAGAVRGLRSAPGGVRNAGVVPDGRSPEVVFLYPGQGAQYPNMGRGLYESEAAYREAVDACCEVLTEPLGLDLRKILYPAAGEEQAAAETLRRTSLTQPALFVTEYALTELLQRWGMQPVAMLGHSIGELVAACVSGALERDVALCLVAARGRLMGAAPVGVMVSLLALEETAQTYTGEGIWLSVINGPQASVLSCTQEAVAELEKRLETDGITYQRLRTSHGFHCGLMDGVLEPLEEVARMLEVTVPRLPYVSNVTGDWISDAEVQDPGYWSRQVRNPVRFSEGVETLLKRHPDALLIEIGPGQVLSQLVRGASAGRVSAVVSTLGGAQDADDTGEWLARGLGELWCAGGEVDWLGAVCGERHLKVDLPTYPYQRKRYWVDTARPVIATQVPEREHDISRWFHVPTWQRALPDAVSSAARTPGCWLFFGEDIELVRTLAASLREAGHRVSMVRTGEHFTASDADYRMRPEVDEDYDALLEHLAGHNALPDHVVHLWALTEDAMPDADQLIARCFHAPVNLVQSLGRRGHDAPLQITFVSNQLQEVTGAEELCPEKATLIGPCRVIPLEYPHIVCRSIDLMHSMSREVEVLLHELYSGSPDAFVAYRNGYRWTPSHQRSPLDAVDGVPLRLRQGGVYLITGGLGGVGLTLAGYLAEACNAKLALVSRSGLPPRHEWDSLLTADPLDEALVARIRAVQKLEAAGAKVMVERADVCSREQMVALLERVRDRFGPVAGVIHAAGVAGGGVIQMKTAAAANKVLAPKVQGARILVDLLRDVPPDFMLLCSSVNALFGVPGQVDYCAANAYLDALALRQRCESTMFTVSVNWDTWQEVGMAVDTEVPDAFLQQRRKSLATAIAPSEGIQAFKRVIASGWPRVLVTPRTAAVESAGVTHRPQDEPDVMLAGTHERPELDREYIKYRDELERQIMLIWCELLGLDRIGMEDNFLELGGHSLLATQLLARLRRELGVDWTLDTVFKAPTVAEQAELVRQKKRQPERDVVSEYAKRIKKMSASEREALLAKARQAGAGVK